ncbi:MAG: SpoIIE family protein phosphatase [Phycisphaeraceae bacterium]|nr:SpoIIE family protein phosphatase [Phycisphaeraceae bacterium]
MAKGFAATTPLNAIEPYDRVFEIDDGSGQIRHFPLIGQTITAGRIAEVDIQLNNTSVSRKHAEFYCDRWGRWWVRDLGSSNGTHVNGFLTTQRMLELADCVELGQCKLTLTMPDPSMEPCGGTSIAGQVVEVHSSPDSVSGLSILRQSLAGSARISAMHLNQLMEMSQTLHRTEQQRERLRLLCELMVSEHFSADIAVVLMINKKEAGSPQTLCVPQVRTGCVAQSLYITDALLDACKTCTEPTLVKPSQPQGAAATDTRLAAMACPIRNDEDVLVLLYLMVRQNFANEEWLTLASLASEHFKQAESSWVNRKLAKVNALVEVDLERARDIQMRLVPSGIKIPDLDVAIGFKPCRWVGGDYVDVLRLSTGNVLLVVADVCGKGLPASLVSSSLHTMVHTVTAAGADMVNMTCLLNRHLVTYLPTNRFVTAILIELNLKTGQLQFINAGHPSPLILDAAGNKRDLKLGGYEPLGIRDVAYQASDDILASGELLAMFTDGLTELKDRSGKMLTCVRLGDHLSQIATNCKEQPVDAAAEQLNQILDAYTGNRLQSDDRTFLMARR